jgi:hypothetical protein
VSCPRERAREVRRAQCSAGHRLLHEGSIEVGGAPREERRDGLIERRDHHLRVARLGGDAADDVDDQLQLRLEPERP